MIRIGTEVRTRVEQQLEPRAHINGKIPAGARGTVISESIDGRIIIVELNADYRYMRVCYNESDLEPV